MQIGVPNEVKLLEGRVGLIPAAAAEMVLAGHQVLLEQGAGLLSGYADQAYLDVGVKIVADAQTLYGEAELIVKVKEPVAAEIDLLRKDHILFSYLHLAANAELMLRLQDIGLTALAFETVELEGGGLPLLAPMSDIAGRIAAQVGTTLLHSPNGGKGVLLGGLPAASRGRVVVLGGGVAGGAAASLVAATGAEVIVFDKDRGQLEKMRALGANVTALYAYSDQIRDEVRRADLLIGAVLRVGERAPHMVSTAMVETMEAGSVIIDISVDQGGCVETTHPTTWADPVFEYAGVLHFAVTNMPGSVPRTASQALSASLIPYVLCVANQSWRDHPALLRGLNIEAGKRVHSSLLDI